MATTVSVERVIRSEADRLWASVADVTRMPEWSPETVSATWLDPVGPASVDARFEGTNRHGRKTWKTVCTVTASEQGRVFAFRVKAGPLPIAEWSYTFEPVEHATVVVESWTDRRNALARLVSTLVTGVKDRRTHNRATMEHTLDNLERHAEATARP
jgi:ribosome-associated toxin RatA of RatAB toxin-antitoxin module